MLCNGNSCLFFFFLVRTMNFQWLSPFLSLDILGFFSVPTSFFAAVVISLRMDNGSSEQICTEKKKRDAKKNVLFEFSSRKTPKPRKKRVKPCFLIFAVLELWFVFHLFSHPFSVFPLLPLDPRFILTLRPFGTFLFSYSRFH